MAETGVDITGNEGEAAAIEAVPADLGVVLAAAGSSQRLGFDKLFTPVLGKTVFQEGLERIIASPRVAEIVVAVAAHNEETVRRLIEKSPKPIRVVLGGAERQDSVIAGLAALDPAIEYVMIQDAARPFVTHELIERVLAEAKVHGAAVCGHPVIDTLKETEDGQTVLRTVDRSRIWAVQTPQIFYRPFLAEAYAAINAGGHAVTDDTAAMEAMGRPVALVRHDDLNLKITRKADWEIGIRQFFPIDDDIKVAADLRKLVHDFSNQVTSLLGFAYLLDADCPEDSPLKNSINCLNESVQRCHEITLTLQRYGRELHAKKTGLQQGLTNPVPKVAAKTADAALTPQEIARLSGS